MTRLSAIVAAIAGAALVVAAARAQARVEFDCKQLARAVGQLADFRDTGADLEKVIALVAVNAKIQSRGHWVVVEREIRRLWHEGLSQGRAEARLYKRCSAQLGDMGLDS